MIQFNLLPDVKLEYVKAKRNKRLVISVAVMVMVVCVILIALIASAVYGVQRAHISNIDEDIAEYTNAIEEIEDINRILTVQNQLNTINGLHEDKPVVSRLFNYIETITPSNVSINQIEVSFENSTMTISGEADTLATVNKYVDTIKFTNYAIGENDEEETDNQPNGDEPSNNAAFSDVVLDSFGRTNDEVSYTIELSFDPIIFDSAERVSLELQNRITTRSELERPQALFRTPTEEDNAQ